ncbi:hypothetical protein [Mucilaginibacter terrae]|uniref:DUF4595 domain-containing protein n=1 Tax=Mucilaginibacter terrae TaxID=1955052 RepID=A0ABU3GRN4_9SPHI|nr:hypothetical protein [Mucilaginibacter terrae]MDT3402438.1 hypothetical protein [Mucilaginibacter terrae]
MNLLNRFAILLLSIIVFQSCKKSTVQQSAGDNDAIIKTPVDLVKYVTWDVGVTHKLEFVYNADSKLKQYSSGSSNLAWKHTGTFNYQNGKPTEMIYDGALNTRYTYANGKVSQKSYLGNGGAETARFNYTYNAKGQAATLKHMVALNGVLSLTEDIIYQYDANGILTQTQSKWYDEHSALLATVVRKYESWSPVVYINPFALLHSLYQHQAQDVFNDVVLSTLDRLPLKITENGNPELGPATYEYHITQTGKRIDKLNCTLKVGNISYDTTEAIFHY